MVDFQLGRLPTTDDELYHLVTALWGVTIPRHKVCPEHVAPFTAFADAYFARNTIDPDSPIDSMALWHGSRGLSGKSFMLSILGITEAFLLGTKINLLGGSLAQSNTIHEHMREALYSTNAPRYMIKSEGNTTISLTNGARIRPLTASQKTVRGPHPSRILLDEIDEMDLPILDAALGQPMAQMAYTSEIIKPFTVMCLAAGTDVMVFGGSKPIEKVEPGDLVLTRKGWAPVSQRIDNGWRPTVDVHLSNGQVLTCTPDHRIAVPGGWSTPAQMSVGQRVIGLADVSPAVLGTQFSSSSFLLFPTSTTFSSTVGRDEGVFERVLVPAGAVRFDSVQGGWSSTTQDVDPISNSFQMVGVAAGSHPAEVIQRPVVGNGPNEHCVSKSMNWSSMDSSIHLAISQSLGSVPEPTIACGYSAPSQEPLTVVDIVTGSTPTSHTSHVWDLTVLGEPEFVASSVIVHNCSTWQNPNGTFTEIMKRAEEDNIPIYRWCFLDTANPVDGWLSQEAIEEKKRSIPAEMWRVEYELGEPSIGNRAFDTPSVEETFAKDVPVLWEKVHKDFEEVCFQEPIRDAKYVAAADWAKEKDYTVITVARVDTPKREIVYYIRLNRRPYPVMIRYFNTAINRYNAQAEHDATGLGNVIGDLLDGRARNFLMVGVKRADMLSEFVSAVENHKWQIPKRLRVAYTEMKYCQVGDLYSNAMEYHLPDTICSFGLLEHQAKRMWAAVGPEVVRKDPRHINRYQQMFEPHQATYEQESETRLEGAVQQRVSDQTSFSFAV